MSIKFCSLATLAIIGTSAWAAPSHAESDLKALAKQSVSPDERKAQPAIAALRAKGPAGLQALLETHRQALAKGLPSADVYERSSNSEFTRLTSRAMSQDWSKLREAIDGVSQQRDGWASRLYWYTDFAQAKAASKASGKPILELRLLGKLNEEYSCANSRFFRTALYPNAAISQYLRDNYILHWHSVRPVPRVTIDFGDGRRIETTITGNSIHYVLDSEGRPLEALPGMVGPQPFLRWLTRSYELAGKYKAVDSSSQTRRELLSSYHGERLETLNRDWAADIVKAHENKGAPLRRLSGRVAKPEVLAIAAELAKMTEPVEPVREKFRLPGLPEELSAVQWSAIAQLHLEDAALDQNSKRVFETRQPTALASSRLTVSKAVVENPLMRGMLNFQRTVAEDSVYNEYALHAQIHDWFAGGYTPENIDVLNKRVYDQLFLTPDSDPWLGLLPQGVFTGLPNDGVVMPEKLDVQLAGAPVANSAGQVYQRSTKNLDRNSSRKSIE